MISWLPNLPVRFFHWKRRDGEARTVATRSQCSFAVFFPLPRPLSRMAGEGSYRTGGRTPEITYPGVHQNLTTTTGWAAGRQYDSGKGQLPASGRKAIHCSGSFAVFFCSDARADAVFLPSPAWRERGATGRADFLPSPAMRERGRGRGHSLPTCPKRDTSNWIGGAITNWRPRKLGLLLTVRGGISKLRAPLRGHSSAGRALAWHARGRRFDPGWLHHPSVHNIMSIFNGYGKIA